MPFIPDLTDPRYLDEIGWFLYHEKHGRNEFGGSYAAERREYSRLLLEEVANYLKQEPTWLEDKTVVSIGCGCSGDLTTFPSRVKIAIDPLLYVYQQLGLLMRDEAGSPTIYLSIDSEELPLLSDFADLVICRNALDHMHCPAGALKEMRRILTNDGALFLSVDLGGEPTPDEPTVFSAESLEALLLQEHFEIISSAGDELPHSGWRQSSMRIIARKKPQNPPGFDKEEILRRYAARLGEDP
ncbi:MAG TPA: methyltransferase domain-containing protein [Candidatus Binatia bacterium]|nr:methyltransferase domain-containing protein [Candidatus Binatia bacterium]